MVKTATFKIGFHKFVAAERTPGLKDIVGQPEAHSATDTPKTHLVSVRKFWENTTFPLSLRPV